MAVPRTAYEQNTTNNKADFRKPYMGYIAGAGNGDSQMDLYIISDLNISGKIDTADGIFQTNLFNVIATQVAIVLISVISFLGNAYGIFCRGIHILSQKPVAIYVKSVSCGMLLLSVNMLGKDYLSIKNYYTQLSNSLHLNTYPGYTVEVFIKNYE